MRVLFIFLFISALLCANNMSKIDGGVDEISSKIVFQMKKYHIKRIAIGDFSSNGVKTMFERYIESEVINNIISRGLNDISIIERRRLSEVLEEQKLGTAGLLEKSTRSAIGKILGVGAIVSGETTVTSKEAKVNVRLYDVNTGSILAAPSFTFSRNETIDELMGEPVMANKRKDAYLNKKKALTYKNRASQRIDYILLTVAEVKKVGKEVQLTLRFKSTHRKKGASVALYAKDSDGLADFWKFFPRPKLAELVDENGNLYKFKSSTMRFAKTNKDWTIIQVNAEQVVRFTFKQGDFKMGKHFTLSVLIRTATANKKGKAVLSSATIYLDNLVAN